MNKSMLMGRITKELEIRTSQSGTSFVSFTIAVPRKFSKEKETDFISCKAFGKTAENIVEYFKKGSMIAIEGRIQTGSYEKDGNKVYTTDVIVDGFHFTGEKKDKQEENTGWVGEAIANTVDTVDDLPF